MSWLTILNIVGLAAAAALVWLFLRTRAKNQLERIATKRRGGSKLVEQAEFVENGSHIPVVLSLTDQSIFYENMEIAAQIDLERIDEVEYSEGFGREATCNTFLRPRDRVPASAVHRAKLKAPPTVDCRGRLTATAFRVAPTLMVEVDRAARRCFDL